MTAPLVCSACGATIDGRAVTTREHDGRLYCVKCYAILPGSSSLTTGVQAASVGNPAATFAILMMIAGVGLGIYGAYLAFHDLAYDEKLVGGDAFNMQIYAARGLVAAVGGAILILAGLTAATLGNYRRG